MKNKIAAVVLAASMLGTAVMPAASVFAAEDTTEETVETTDEAEDADSEDTAEDSDSEDTAEEADAEDTDAEESEDAVEYTVKEDAAEADFNGVWKIKEANLFGENVKAEDGKDGFFTIEDGKMSVYAYADGETTDVSDIDLTFEDGKYVLNLDEDLANKLQEDSEEESTTGGIDISGLITDEVKDKIKELTEGNTSRMEFQMTDDGQLLVDFHIEISNDYYTFSTGAIQLVSEASTQDAIDEAKKAAEEDAAATSSFSFDGDTDGTVTITNDDDADADAETEKTDAAAEDADADVETELAE